MKAYEFVAEVIEEHETIDEFTHKKRVYKVTCRDLVGTGPLSHAEFSDDQVSMGAIIPREDLVLYSHFPNKLPRYFDLIERWR